MSFQQRDKQDGMKLITCVFLNMSIWTSFQPASPVCLLYGAIPCTWKWGWLNQLQDLSGRHKPVRSLIKKSMKPYTVRFQCSKKQTVQHHVTCIHKCICVLVVINLLEFYVLLKLKTDTNMFYYQVDISTASYSYSCAVQCNTMLHDIAWALGLCDILATMMCFN